MRTRLVRQLTFIEGSFGASLLVAAIVLSQFGRRAWETAPELLGLALSVLVVIELPVLVWFLVLRRRGFSPLVILPVAAVGLAMAKMTLPSAMDADGFLYTMGWVIGVGQVAVVYRWIVLGLNRAIRAEDRGDRLTRTLGRARAGWPGSWVAVAFAYEGVVLAYALGVGRSRSSDGAEVAVEPEGPRIEQGGRHECFSIDRATGLLSLLWTVLFLAAVELLAVHFLVAMWSARTAWLLSAVELYGVLWVLGLIRSIRRRPIEVRGDRVMVRFGILYDAEFSAGEIARIETSSHGFSLQRDSALLLCAVLNPPNVLLTLKGPVDVSVPYGLKRKVTRIALLVDEPALFSRAVERLVGPK